MKEFSQHELEFLRWLLKYYLLEYVGYGKDLAMLALAGGLLKNIEKELANRKSED